MPGIIKSIIIWLKTVPWYNFFIHVNISDIEDNRFKFLVKRDLLRGKPQNFLVKLILVKDRMNRIL